MGKTTEIANKYVELCRQGKNGEALDTLFADDAVSVEALSMAENSSMMQSRPPIRAAAVRLFLAGFAGSIVFAAFAHESRIGAIEIVHPYATPSLAGTKNGAAYLLSVENKGSAPDRIVRASTPVAARVGLHTMAVDPQGMMRMREVEAIAIGAKSKIAMRPGLGFHFMLLDLKQPLKDGDTFPLTIVFEKAGPVEVKAVVQTLRARSGAASHSH